MPIYEFKCDECEAVREVQLPMSEARQMPTCECGQKMRRKFSPINFNMPQTGRDKVLGTLNQEEGAQDYPGGDKHRARYDRALARGLDQRESQCGQYRPINGARS